MIDYEKEQTVVTDKVLIAERKLSQSCIHCGEPFNDDYGWFAGATCNNCAANLPGKLNDVYWTYTIVYKRGMAEEKNKT